LRARPHHCTFERRATRSARPPRVKRSSFYESDCQGHTSASLIAGRCFSRQSAPTAEGTRPAGASGLARQSFCASFSPWSSRSEWTSASTGALAHARRAMVLSETRPREAGLTLVRVLRGGLGLGECLGGLRGRANELLETAPRTRVPDPGAAGEGTSPHLRPWSIRR